MLEIVLKYCLIVYNFISPFLDLYDYILAMILFLYLLKTNASYYIKGLALVLFFDMLFTCQNYLFDIEMNSLIGAIEILLISYYLFCKGISYNIKTISSIEELDENYLYYLGRKPQSIKEWLRNIHTINLCSSGFMAYSNMWNSYQMRFKFSTLQKIPRYKKTLNNMLNDYYIIKTDILKKDLDLKFPNWEEVLLQQKARNWNTLFRRTNCFKSLRPILNKKYSKKFIFRFWFLPWSSELNWVIWKIKGII